MAEAIYLVTRRDALGKGLVNGLFAAVVNSDSAGTDAEKLADADVGAIRAGHAIKSPYFDTVVGLISTASDLVADDLDVLLFVAAGQPAVVNNQA